MLPFSCACTSRYFGIRRAVTVLAGGSAMSDRALDLEFAGTGFMWIVLQISVQTLQRF